MKDHILYGTSRTVCEVVDMDCLDGIVNVDSFVRPVVTINKYLNFEKFVSNTI